MRLKISHDMQVAHRLSLSPGKCQQMHGHGMQIELTLLASEGPGGIAVNYEQEALEFGDMKKKFREYIDTTYDHHLLLNKSDPWAIAFDLHDPVENDPVNGKTLPGLVTVPGDPTTENLAKWIAEWGCNTFKCDVICRLDETKTNGAEAMYMFNGKLGPKFAGGAR